MNMPYNEGPLDAKICLIGEAPGVDEERQGRPFVGSAGKVLDRLLMRAGIHRAECRIENVVQERPPANDISHFINISKSKPYITPIGQRYIEQLTERLAQCSANVFVPLGNVPMWVLTGMKGVTERRGSIIPATRTGLEGRKVIPTIHPAAALRQYTFQHFIAYDLKRVKSESETPQINLIRRNLQLDPSFNDVIRYIEKCHEYPMVGFDIEVYNDEVSHVSLSIAADNAMSIPFFDSSQSNFTPDQDCQIWLALRELLESPDTIKLGQNLTFDNTFVFRRLGIIVKPVEDTMVMSGIAFPDFPKGLGFLTSVYCSGEPYFKDEGKKWFKNPFETVKEFRRYSAMDAAVLHEIYAGLEADLRRLGNWETYRRQLCLLEPLTYIASRGIRMNTEGLKQASIDTAARIRELEAELHEITGAKLNIKSPKQLKTYFYIVKGEKPYIKKGSPTVDETALLRLAAKGYREANIILELRHLHKMKGTYYEVILDADNRLRCSWNPVGTKQGRVSSSKTIFDTGANLQNQPKEMSKFMLADEGCILVKQDLSQAENRVVAYVANEHNMIQAFKNGRDIHSHTASLIYGIDISKVTKEQRGMGKRTNHGLNYAMGHRRFALLHSMSLQDSQFLVERYHLIYPGVRQWHASIRQQLAKDRRLTNLFGRVRLFMDRWGDEMFKEAYSFIPQSTVAEKLNAAMYTIYNEDAVDLLNNIHDAVVYQIPLSLGAAEILRRIRRNAEILEAPLEANGRSFVIPIDTEIGFNAYDTESINLQNFTEKDLEAFIDAGAPKLA